MYLGLIALWRAVEDPSRAGAPAAAILTLVGRESNPVRIIKFSVDWWNTAASARRPVCGSARPFAGSRLFDFPLLVDDGRWHFHCCLSRLHLAAMRNEILLRRRVARVAIDASGAASRRTP